MSFYFLDYEQWNAVTGWRTMSLVSDVSCCCDCLLSLWTVYGEVQWAQRLGECFNYFSCCHGNWQAKQWCWYYCQARVYSATVGMPYCIITSHFNSKCIGADTRKSPLAEPQTALRKQEIHLVECGCLSCCRNSKKNCFLVQNFTEIAQLAVEL